MATQNQATQATHTTTAAPATTATSTGTSTTNSLSSTASSLLPNGTSSLTNGASSLLGNGASTTGTNGAAGTNAAGNSLAGNNAAPGSTGSGDSQRSPVPTAQGVHIFKSGQFTATAYSCTRSGSRVLCDFDVTRQSAAETGQQIWNQMILVDDGGKISHRHDAYYVFDDGTQGNNAYLTSKPVRMIMEFDDVGANASSATLAVGQDRADAIPISSNETSGGGETQEASQTPAASKAGSGKKSH